MRALAPQPVIPTIRVACWIRSDGYIASNRRDAKGCGEPSSTFNWLAVMRMLLRMGHGVDVLFFFHI